MTPIPIFLYIHKQRSLLILLFSASCKKKAGPNVACDLNDYVGQWSFIYNDDPATLYTGKIDKFSDEVINLAFQPDTKNLFKFYYFEQVNIDCAKYSVVYMLLPAENHGTTTIEGTITEIDFDYTRTKVLQTPFGEQITITHIVGVRLE